MNKTTTHLIDTATLAICPPALHDFLADQLHDDAREDDLYNHLGIKINPATITLSDLAMIILYMIPDTLTLESDNPDFALTADDAAQIMTYAHLFDPSESNIAATIRDTLRDNFEF